MIATPYFAIILATQRRIIAQRQDFLTRLAAQARLVKHDAIGDDLVAKIRGSVAHRAHVFRNTNRRHVNDELFFFQQQVVNDESTMMLLLLLLGRRDDVGSHVDLTVLLLSPYAKMIQSNRSWNHESSSL
jgi:hypothetical protein